MPQDRSSRKPKKSSKPSSPLLVAGLKSATVTPRKTQSNTLAELKPGDVFDASAQVLGKDAVKLSGTMMGDGTQFLTIPFEKNGFTFDALFSSFKSVSDKLFIFDNVDIHVEKSEQSGSAFTVDFIGELRIDKAPLNLIAQQLNILQPPLMSAQIETKDGDLSDKIAPQKVSLKSPQTIEVNIGPLVSLSETCFQVDIEQAKKDGQWEFNPSANGLLEIADIADEPLEFQCQVDYKDKTLTLDAKMAEATNLFDIQGLSLSQLNISGKLGQAKELMLDAEFKTKNKTYQLSGGIAEQNIGLFCRQSEFEFSDLNQVVKTLAGFDLKIPQFDVSFKNLLLGFANNEGKFGDTVLSQGLTLTSEIDIFGYTTDTKINISQEGVSLSADLNQTKVGPVTIKEAELSLKMYAKSSGKDAEFAISGEAEIEGLTVDCKVAFERQSGEWQQILYAMLKAESFVMSSVFPPAKGTFVDTIEFKKLGFIYSTFNGASQDKALEFDVKKGLQLVGSLKQLPALNTLTKQQDLNMILSASFGAKKTIGISLPDTKLDLSKSVTTSPIKIGVELAPSPSLDLVFGLDAKVPKQTTPLHFDANLSVGAVEASGGGTMKNYWENPFGVQGLKIGPALALEIGIIYQQFIATGIPSSFGFVGGLALGDVSAQMALKISENPSEEILMGKLDQLSPANLVSFVNDATGSKIKAKDVPNFFDLEQLEIYVAPMGGAIGTVEFDKGFSFSADLVLFKKRMGLHARLADDGFEADGHIDKIDFGPLKISGKKGKDAEIDLELTTSKQSLFIDGEIEFIGNQVGIFADISNQGIEFSFEQRFVDLLSYQVEGKSYGSIDKPASLDFDLSAEFDNGITAYLKNDLSKKITAATKVVNQDIKKAQDEVDRTEKVYKAEFDKAKANLDSKKAAADKALNVAQSGLNQAKKKYQQDLTKAKKTLASAKKSYDSAFNAASKKLNKAQADYNRGVSLAQAEVDKAEKAYTKALSSAQQKVNKAQRDYNNAISTAKRSFDAAQRKVNGLNSSIRSAKSKLKKEKRKTFPNPFKLAQYGSEIAGLEIAKGTATVALKAAKSIMEGVTKGAEYAAFNSAKAALEAVKQGGKYTAFESAKAGLRVAKSGANYTAFKAAKEGLKAVQEGTKFTAWQAAQQALTVADAAGKEAINIASKAVSDVAKSAVWASFKAAEAALEAVKQGSAFVAFQSAQVALQAAKASAGFTLKLANYIAQHAGDIIDIRHVSLSAKMKRIIKGDFFVANVDMSLLGKTVKATVDFDVNNIGKFIENLFKLAMKEMESIVK